MRDAATQVVDRRVELQVCLADVGLFRHCDVVDDLRFCIRVARRSALSDGRHPAISTQVRKSKTKARLDADLSPTVARKSRAAGKPVLTQ